MHMVCVSGVKGYATVQVWHPEDKFPESVLSMWVPRMQLWWSGWALYLLSQGMKYMKLTFKLYKTYMDLNFIDESIMFPPLRPHFMKWHANEFRSKWEFACVIHTCNPALSKGGRRGLPRVQGQLGFHTMFWANLGALGRTYLKNPKN